MDNKGGGQDFNLDDVRVDTHKPILTQLSSFNTCASLWVGDIPTNLPQNKDMGDALENCSSLTVS